MSPLSRGAWIEIMVVNEWVQQKVSRPSRGGRGLKCGHGHASKGAVRSPLSRGAWIEICRLYV